MKPEKYLKTIKHGGFKSFLKKVIEIGVRIEIIYDETGPLVKLSHKNRVVFCNKANVPLYRRMGNLTKNKVTTKIVLDSVGIRTPRGAGVHSYKEALREITKKKLRYPLIAKPVDGSLAKGVTWDIHSLGELKSAIRHAQMAYGKRHRVMFLIEEMFIGKEYRVLVFNGKVLSCVQKIAAGVTGDGRSDIQTLIHRFNKARARGFEIKLDSVAKQTLQKNGFTLKSVLPKGRFFQLRHNLNMSDGGRSIDHTHRMSKKYKDIAERSIAAVGLTYGGIDIFVKDISSSEEDYVIIEINPHPFYNMHEKPLVEGKGVDVSLQILKHLFPGLKKA